VAGACGTRGPGPRAGPGLGRGRARAAGLALPLLLWQLLALAGGGAAFYLEVRELEEKCFIQEIPDGTVVIGNYKTELYDPAMEKYQPSPQWINLFVFVKDPENKNLLARQYGPRGSFTFTSQSPGEHEVCLHLKSIRFALFYDGKLAIHLDMQLGEHTNDHTELAANDKLTLLHLRIQRLVEQVEKIQKEQEYQRVRGWRSTSDRPVRAPIRGCCGGPSCRPLSLWPLASGRCSTSRASLKPRSWCKSASETRGLASSQSPAAK
uniref:GOLD domain-containing protein n=1 Tax=Bos mutus grunniens TaxID=30521 RepID=A0A8B9X3V5_BOSMU